MESGFSANEGSADLEVLLVGKLSGEFAEAEGVDGGFKGRNSGETPFVIYDALRQDLFVVGSGGEFFEVAVR